MIVFISFILGMILAASACQQVERENPAEHNEALAEQYIEAYNARDRTALEEILADPFIVLGEEYELGMYLDLIESYWGAFPDITLEPKQIIGGENNTTVRMTFSATGSGEFLGHNIDGKEVNVSEIYLFGVSNGKLSELWYNWDELGFWTQLGVLESPYAEE